MPTSILLFLFFNKEQRVHRVILLTFVSSIFLIKEVLKGFHCNLYYSSVIDSQKDYLFISKYIKLVLCLI